MFTAAQENNLIVVDIVDTMTQYVSLQPDVDETKVKASALVAQNIDIKRVIGETNLQRCIDGTDETDLALKELVIPALCYFTYARLLRMFSGVMTDSGYEVDVESTDRATAKEVMKEHQAIAEEYMLDVITFLEDESDEDVDSTKLTPRIRPFGGKENRASN